MELVEPFGTWTITVRLNPYTVSVNVVEPGDVVPHPGDVAAAELADVRPPKFAALMTRTMTAVNAKGRNQRR